ncbi:class I SAM-dependent methyltransferase [Dactylosporangium sp. NPDC049525]|uniref:class I SAM-dependent methyltransferase n=1 Tax=Dactylosporangium sp. NPDC049525 TaxID=3154730 RepID=UPI0034272F2E
MEVRYQDVIGPLRAAYDARAGWRDGLDKEPWKVTERAAFLDRLRAGGCGRLLEIGAGTGQDSAFFQGQGLDVVAIDVSPAMVAYCRAKGLEAHARDFLSLVFPAGSFDAVYAMNCLLHVPNRDLPAVLDAVAAVLRPGGLCFVGVWAGPAPGEGPLDGDAHDPPRFFAWRGDEELQAFARRRFEVADFHVVPVDGKRFQSLTLRARSTS